METEGVEQPRDESARAGAGEGGANYVVVVERALLERIRQLERQLSERDRKVAGLSAQVDPLAVDVDVVARSGVVVAELLANAAARLRSTRAQLHSARRLPEREAITAAIGAADDGLAELGACVERARRLTIGSQPRSHPRLSQAAERVAMDRTALLLPADEEFDG